MRSGGSGDDERGVSSAPAKRDRRGDRGLDPLATREPGGQHEERIGAVEIEPFREARPRRRETERFGYIDAVRHDGDAVARETGERGELTRPFLRDGDVPHGRMRARDEIPRLAAVALRCVLGIAPGEVVRPADHQAWTL